jgi:hypothetical protein
LEWAFGFLFGILTPLFGLAVFFQVFPELKTVGEWRDPAWQLILVRLTTFGVIMNAAMFFLALYLNKEAIAMGILWACGVYLAPLLIMQFIT